MYIQIVGFLLVLMVVILGLIIWNQYLLRFRYILKIEDPSMQMNELNKYMEKGKKLDNLYYNTLTLVQIQMLDFKNAENSNEMMRMKTWRPTAGMRLIYENNRCLILGYLEKYPELELCIVDFEKHINSNRHNQHIKDFKDTLIAAKLNIAIANNDSTYAKILLEELTNVSANRRQFNSNLINLYTAKIAYMNGEFEIANQIIDKLIDVCGYLPIVHQAEILRHKIQMNYK